MMGAQRVCWSSMLPPWTWSAQLAACPSGTAHHLCHGLHLQRNRPPQPNSGDSRSAQLPCASTLAASTRRESLRGDVLSFFAPYNLDASREQPSPSWPGQHHDSLVGFWLSDPLPP
ncbi:hypothetical protein HDV57DRAFT_164923 [Trichoderma longibrachiatum]